MKAKLWIGGEWRTAQEYAPLCSPFSGEVIAEIPIATTGETEGAIQAATDAARMMRDLPAHRRALILERAAELLQARSEQAAELLAKEAGKPLTTARVEIARTVQTYKFAAEEAKRIHGETLPMDAAPGGEGRTAYTVREPIGVVAAITPFNFPFNLVAHKVGPAIAAGNTVVLKPASQTPLSAFMIGEIFEEAGLPAGALNIVTGQGRTVGDLLVRDPRVKKVTFTGSPEVGMAIRNQAGLKRVTLELGSNAALIVDRGVDIASIVDRCVSGAFAYQGQVCISLQRVYVHEDVYDVFTDAFIAATKRLRPGDPLDPATDISAMISPKESQRAISWIAEAVQTGAELAYGGIMEGAVLMPTILLEAAPRMKVSCQEVFAPIVLINKVTSIREAIEAVNDSRYGLQAGIYTPDISTAFAAVKQLEVGGVIVNDIPTFRVDHMPYGGVKESGLGREGVKYAIEEMTEIKLVVINHK